MGSTKFSSTIEVKESYEVFLTWFDGLHCFRFNQVIFKSENVLSPEVLQDMYNLTMRMRQVFWNLILWNIQLHNKEPVKINDQCSKSYFSLSVVPAWLSISFT